LNTLHALRRYLFGFLDSAPWPAVKPSTLPTNSSASPRTVNFGAASFAFTRFGLTIPGRPAATRSSSLDAARRKNGNRRPPTENERDSDMAATVVRSGK
jgi:hypothetical protein